MRDLLGDIRGRALWVVVGCLVCQMGLGFGYAAGPLAPPMLAELGWTRAWLASAQAPQSVLIALASPLVGFGVARYGARPVLCWGALALGTGYALFAAMQAWWQLAVAWAFVGLGVAGLGDIAVGAVVAQWVTRSRGLALGIVYTGSNIGGFFATRAMVAIAGAWSWRIAVAAAALSAVAILLPVAWLAVRDRALAGAAPGDPAAEAWDADDRDLDLGRAWRTRSFWIVAFTLFGFWAYLYAVLNHFSLTLVDAGLSVAEAGPHMANLVGMGLVSKIAFGWIADRMNAKSALLLDYGLLGLASLALVSLATAASPPAIWAFVLVFGFSYAARDVVTPLILVHCFGSRYLAKNYGVLMLTILPGSWLGSILTGWTHDQTGSYTPAYVGLVVWSAVSFALLLAVRDERAR